MNDVPVRRSETRLGESESGDVIQNDGLLQCHTSFCPLLLNLNELLCRNIHGHEARWLILFLPATERLDARLLDADVEQAQRVQSLHTSGRHDSQHNNDAQAIQRSQSFVPNRACLSSSSRQEETTTTTQLIERVSRVSLDSIRTIALLLLILS